MEHYWWTQRVIFRFFFACRKRRLEPQSIRHKLLILRPLEAFQHPRKMSSGVVEYRYTRGSLKSFELQSLS